LVFVFYFYVKKSKDYFNLALGKFCFSSMQYFFALKQSFLMWKAQTVEMFIAAAVFLKKMDYRFLQTFLNYFLPKIKCVQKRYHAKK